MAATAPSPASFGTSFDHPPERRGTGSLKWDRFAGRDVLPFWVADMDFESPPEVIEAARRRVEHGVFGYARATPTLVDTVLAYLRERHGVEAEPEWLVWLPGLVPALNMACRAFGDPGDSVITCSPVYPPFLTAPRNADRRLVDVPLRFEADARRWTFDFEALEAAVRPDTRVFLLCNPHNPTGRVYGDEELEAVLAFCERHDLILCADEVHSDLILEPAARHRSAALQPAPRRDRIITLMAPSKTFNLAGLAFSFAIIPDAGVRRRFRRAGEGFLAEVNAVGFAAAEAAYRAGEPWRLALVDYLRANRDALYAFADRHLPDLELAPMEATYLAWIDARRLGHDDPTAHFEKAGVGLSDGRTFGLPGFVRFNFGCSRTLMLEGLERMRQAAR